VDGQRATIFDARLRQPVGYAYVDVNREFLATESHGFLRGMLYTTAVGGLLTAAIALLLAAWLSRRITAPVTALTEATQAIAQHGDTALLPVTSSDELGQMSVAFNQMTTALQTQRDLRKRLINDVSHELNTPLSVIQLEAKGLRDGLQTPTRAADQIIQEVNMLRNLVRDLNWLAETETDELRLAVEPCSIHQLLTAEVERWQPQAQMRQIALSLQPLPELPMLNLDRMRMSQALGNVVYNALQHTGVGGRVTVVATMEMGRRVGISVTDDGVGIDAADLPHIFSRFYRTDQSRSRVTGGAGLGLAIARAIIEAHNGTIAVTSDGIGLGTTVRFDLPLH
jgi:signal transduction histidine kinase